MCGFSYDPGGVSLDMTLGVAWLDVVEGVCHMLAHMVSRLSVLNGFLAYILSGASAAVSGFADSNATTPKAFDADISKRL